MAPVVVEFDAGVGAAGYRADLVDDPEGGADVSGDVGIRRFERMEIGT